MNATLTAPAAGTAPATGTATAHANTSASSSHRPDTTTILPLADYDLIVVGFSGGKDSLAALLNVLDRCDAAGVPRERIEAWHHLVDGDSTDGLFDWPITDSYGQAVCTALGVTYRRSWRVGGLEGELMKKNARSKGVAFENPVTGGVTVVGGTRGTISTRRRWPALSHDLRVRWCSASAKVDVCDSAVANDPRLHDARVLVVTGERREESPARSRYATAQVRHGTTRRRRVDHWRPVLDWSESEVWALIRRHRVRPHPAYTLGFSRVSCLTCIFHDSDGWASVRDVAPARLERIANREKELGHTVRIGLSVIDQADQGVPFSVTADPAMKALAMAREYPADMVLVPAGEEWVLPVGAYRRCPGPS